MAIVEPYDILAGWPGWQTAFALVERGDISRQKNGVTRTKLGVMPLWSMSVVSINLIPNRLDALKGMVEGLAGLQTLILGYSLSRCYPIAYPNGSWPTGGAFSGTTASLSFIGSNNRSVRVSSLPAAFALQSGDMIQIAAGNLHRVREAAIASGAGLTPAFEVHPPLWPGTATGQAVSVRKPHCLMRIVPGSVSASADPRTGRGTVSFEAMEARDA
jgi:hypothetical protein